jgi:hypothetical protein
MKRIFRTGLLCFFLLISLSACRHEWPFIPPNTVLPISPVHAGVLDSNMVLHENLAGLPIPTAYDSVMQFRNGVDSVDLDGDGKIDFDILLRLVNPDSMYLVAQGAMVPQFRLSGRDDWRIALYVESFPIGLGQSGHADWAAKLPYQALIDTSLDFRRELRLWMQHPSPFPYSYGPWYLDHSTAYLGVVKGGIPYYRYGWIEVENPAIDSIVLRRWAIHN